MIKINTRDLSPNTDLTNSNYWVFLDHKSEKFSPGFMSYEKALNLAKRHFSVKYGSAFIEIFPQDPDKSKSKSSQFKSRMSEIKKLLEKDK